MEISELIYFAFEIIGTIAFAISGSMVAIKKRVDVFGVIVMAAVTALGGGICRDILIGDLPPRMFSDYRYVLAAVVTAVIVFADAYIFRDRYRKKEKLVDDINNFFDAVGLGIFTVTGVRVAIDSGFKLNGILVVCLGVITGVGGGLLRDIMLREIPFVLNKRIYAVASILGGVVYYRMYLGGINSTAAIIVSVAVTFGVRLLATLLKLDASQG